MAFSIGSGFVAASGNLLRDRDAISDLAAGRIEDAARRTDRGLRGGGRDRVCGPDGGGRGGYDPGRVLSISRVAATICDRGVCDRGSSPGTAGDGPDPDSLRGTRATAKLLPRQNLRK